METTFFSHNWQCWKTYFCNLLSFNICVYCRVEDKLSACLKTKTASCIAKKKLKICICVWAPMTWPRSSEYALFSEVPSTIFERHPNYLKCFVTIPLWQPNGSGIRFCRQDFLVQCLPSTYSKLLPFLESIWFFFNDFKIMEYIRFIRLFNSNATSRLPFINFYGFNGITNS